MQLDGLPIFGGAPAPASPTSTRAPDRRSVRAMHSRGRRFWATLRRSPMDPTSNRPICFAYNHDLLKGHSEEGCPRGDRCRFAHVPLEQVPGGEDAAALLALEASWMEQDMSDLSDAETYSGECESEPYEHPRPPPSSARGRAGEAPSLGKVMMPIDPETQRRVCFFHNAMATGCVKGDRCQFVHVKVNLRALGFVGHQPNPLTEAEAARISKLRGMDVGGGVVQQLPPSKGASDTGAKGRRLPSSSKGIGAAAGAQTWGAEATPVHTPTRAASAATRYAPPYPPSLPPSYPRTPPVAPYGGALMPPLPDPGFTRPHLVRHFSFTFAPHPVNAQFLPKTPYAWHGPPFTPPPPPHAQACEMAEAGESPAAAAGWL